MILGKEEYYLPALTDLFKVKDNQTFWLKFSDGKIKMCTIKDNQLYECTKRTNKPMNIGLTQCCTSKVYYSNPYKPNYLTKTYLQFLTINYKYIAKDCAGDYWAFASKPQEIAHGKFSTADSFLKIDADLYNLDLSMVNKVTSIDSLLSLDAEEGK